MSITAVLPDGRELEFPDGTDPTIVQATVKRVLGVKEESPTSAKNLLGAATEPLLAMGTGAIATPIAGLLGIGAGLTNAARLSDVDPGEVVRRMQGALTYAPRTEGGRNAMTAISWPFEKVAEGADYAGGKVTDWTGDPALGAQVNAALNLAPAVLMASRVQPGAVPTPQTAAGATSRYFMRSALKPGMKNMMSGRGPKAVQTLLDEGVNVSRGGLDKLSGRVDLVNELVAEAIKDAKGIVKKSDVLPYLDETRATFRSQVNPAADLAAIDEVAQGFVQHPNLRANAMSVQKAQRLKQGTYQVLKGKYGEQGSASTEAQKALARGLKDEVAKTVPEVGPLNARESALINARDILERRLFTEGNKNPLGLAALANTPGRTAAFLADRSALVKSLLARMLNPGRTIGVTDEALAMLSAPESFTADTERRQRMIDALMRAREE